MLEIEIKAWCDNRNEVINRIVSLGGVMFKRVRERDIYYSHPCRDFAETDEALRIRIEDNTYTLTYKGPKLGKRSKSRFEEEVLFNELSAMKSILNEIGFVEVDNVVKVRDIYILNNVEICVDRVDGVGDFVELEKMGGDRESTESELFALAEELGLKRFERRSYLELKLEIKE